MKESIKLVCSALFWVACGVLLTCCLHKCSCDSNRLTDENYLEKRDTILVTDTIMEVEPVAVSIVATEIVKRKLPVVNRDTAPSRKDRMEIDAMKVDSVEVELEISQAEYRGENYVAWVSGYEPKLDSISILREREVITVEKIETRYKNKHWHIGPTIGYGYGVHGFTPFVGVSLTYSIISF